MRIFDLYFLLKGDSQTPAAFTELQVFWEGVMNRSLQNAMYTANGQLADSNRIACILLRGDKQISTESHVFC